ncbi:LEPR-XLL domain-containing protein [Streptosporangium canum]
MLSGRRTPASQPRRGGERLVQPRVLLSADLTDQPSQHGDARQQDAF